ncbi:hypothetical protein P4123_00345 [Pseudomonas aeruginosa]|nr:hypothetical protein [Pseudomonas aeruginosa]
MSLAVFAAELKTLLDGGRLAALASTPEQVAARERARWPRAAWSARRALGGASVAAGEGSRRRGGAPGGARGGRAGQRLACRFPPPPMPAACRTLAEPYGKPVQRCAASRRSARRRTGRRRPARRRGPGRAFAPGNAGAGRLYQRQPPRAVRRPASEGSARTAPAPGRP